MQQIFEKGKTLLQRMAVIAALALLTLMTFGCGGDSPSATVEGFFKATQANECQKLEELVNPAYVDEFIADCNRYKGQLVDYKIIEERVIEEGPGGVVQFAQVDAEVVLGADGQGSSNQVKLFLVKAPGLGWQLTRIP